MAYEYQRPFIRMKRNGIELLGSNDSESENPWEPPVPEDSATLWRYMSLAKFCSLLQRRELFFSLVGDMEDKYEGFIYPPTPRQDEEPLQQAENLGHNLLQGWARTSLVSCWTESDRESSLMWKVYAGSEGVAIRTTFQCLMKSMPSVTDWPIKAGKVQYVNYEQREISRFGWTPLFHKRAEYREEEEVRLMLPGPPCQGELTDEHLERWDFHLDQDVAEQRGRYVPVNLEVLLSEVVLPPRAEPWFTEVIKSIVQSSTVSIPVRRSSIETIGPIGTSKASQDYSG